MFNRKNDAKTLENFIQNIYFANELSTKESIKNLEESLIELVQYKKYHSSNGLLVTENGYFITNFHCVKGHKKDNIKVNYQGKNYNIKICEPNLEEDLVLAKINLKGEQNPKRYKFFDTNSLKNYYLWDFPINLKTKHDGKIKEKYGHLKFNFCLDKTNKGEQKYANQIHTLIDTEKGDSGGIIIDKEGRLIALHSGAREIDENILELGLVKGKTLANQSKIFSALDLIQRYAHKLKSKTL